MWHRSQNLNTFNQYLRNRTFPRVQQQQHCYYYDYNYGRAGMTKGAPACPPDDEEDSGLLRAAVERVVQARGRHRSVSR